MSPAFQSFGVGMYASTTWQPRRSTRTRFSSLVSGTKLSQNKKNKKKAILFICLTVSSCFINDFNFEITKAVQNKNKGQK